jgi:hypothetical protein
MKVIGNVLILFSLVYAIWIFFTVGTVGTTKEFFGDICNYVRSDSRQTTDCGDGFYMQASQLEGDHMLVRCCKPPPPPPPPISRFPGGQSRQ